jgi:hypothetical protein
MSTVERDCRNFAPDGKQGRRGMGIPPQVVDKVFFAAIPEIYGPSGKTCSHGGFVSLGGELGL